MTAKEMNEPFLRWLHLTDLHIGKNSEPQRVAMKSLVQAIANEVKDRIFDVVILTGDLVYSGQKDEFVELENSVITPLRALPNFKDAKFFAVPGNHDLDCEIGCPIGWATIGHSRQESFFNADEKGQQIRTSRSHAFSEYSNFIKRANIFSADPTREPATMQRITIRDKVFLILPVVTCFFSDKEVQDKQKAPMPVHPIRALLPVEESDHVLAIVIGHHPANWFIQDTERRFDTLIFEQAALYLHGHEHLITPKFSGRGLTSLGFGATYQGSLDSTATTYYRNSFAICELDDLLHVRIISWDGENGMWRPDQHLPVNFAEKSGRLDGGYRFRLPSTALTQSSPSPISVLASAVKADATIERCIWKAEDDIKRWTEILVSMSEITPKSETFKLPARALPSSHVQFRIKDGRGQYLIYGISANGDVLNYEQLQKINTELDTQDYDGCFVLTMGTLAKETKTLADQLSARKSLKVFERTEIVRASIRSFSSAQSLLFHRVDSDRTSTSMVVTDKGFALLFEDQNKHEWFSVVDESGDQALESSELVRKLRELIPSLVRMRYENSMAYTSVMGSVEPKICNFDRKEYLAKSHAYHDDVRYAALAALGLKFKTSSLSEMYVSASADVGGTTKTSQNATRALSELMESLGLQKTQRDQLEAQMRARYGLDKTAEVGAASQLYQRYNNIVMLGDPGSGKTCFLKHEILSYCKGDADGGWYSTHLPIYVSLAEAAQLYVDGTDLIEICSIQSSRRGIDLPRDALERELESGRAAFFFDGLDEVGFIDKRIGLMAEIGKLVKLFAPGGNRFVLASRPAAVQPVDVPDSFTYVQLKGLTEDEMRILAGRVISARLGDMSESPLEKEESELIERLLADTRNSPGIARIARNPLLLTLLVLIYANTGALTAKRHIIYTQAIKTLVSVRGRGLREHQISEADLRTRLGALAVSIFSREIDEIPKRSDVIRVLSKALEFGHRRELPDNEVNEFLQDVAEATGLISIHSEDGKASADDLITFMHFSFLEYYTAAGLLAQDYSQVLIRLSKNPRWKDVTTLMFGILSDHSDVTTDLKTLLHDDTEAGQITQYKLLLGMDCASECDVPPERAQDLLADAIYDTVSKGAGRYSGSLREDIAGKLKYFLGGTGPRMELALVRGLTSSDPQVVACFCHVVASLDSGVELSPKVINAFSQALSVDHSSIRTAAMLAIEKHFVLRGDDAMEVIKIALSGNLSEKHAALKVVNAIPECQTIFAQKVKDLLDDSNPFISELAANSMLVTGLRGGTWTDKDGTHEIATKEKVLAKLNQSDQSTSSSITGITLDHSTIESMFASSNPISKELAIRYVAMIKTEATYVHRFLSRALRSVEAARLRSACLDAFRAAPEALSLVNIADTDFICTLVAEKERNLRIAAIKLLGDLPDDEQVVSTLRTLLVELKGDNTRETEVAEAAKALAKHVKRNSKIRNEVLTSILSFLPDSPDRGFGDKAHQEHIRSLLYVCETIGGSNDIAAKQALNFAEDYRTPDRIRRQCIKVFGRLAEPTVDNVKKLCTLLDKNDPKLKDAVYPAVISFITRCRSKVESVRRIYSTLPILMTSLEKAWRRETIGTIDSIDPAGPRDIRAAVIEIENLTAAYEEFSERATTKDLF
nr:metallophosphoesterase [uncultured Undibacterium sp.]